MTANCSARCLRSLFLAWIAIAVPACTSDGNFTIAGYTTELNYSRKIRTVHVPIFKNETFIRRLEFDLTRAVVDKINDGPIPYRVVSREKADTELLGTIRTVDKGVINRNQQNTVREGQFVLAVELIWRDLRTGEILSKPLDGVYAPAVNRQLMVPPLLNPLSAPGAGPEPMAPAPPPPSGPPPVVIVQSFGTYIPELGGSTSTGYQQAVDRMAVQIISLMEKPW